MTRSASQNTTQNHQPPRSQHSRTIHDVSPCLKELLFVVDVETPTDQAVQAKQKWNAEHVPVFHAVGFPRLNPFPRAPPSCHGSAWTAMLRPSANRSGLGQTPVPNGRPLGRKAEVPTTTIRPSSVLSLKASGALPCLGEMRLEPFCHQGYVVGPVGWLVPGSNHGLALGRSGAFRPAFLA